MKEILAHIEQKKHEFSQLPFFEYLRDQSISPMQRLAFAPCAAPFIMSFGELNRSVFRNEPTSDPIQTIINDHTYEDEHHWLWFLEDLEKLGLNPSESFTNTLKFLWSDESSASRRAGYELYRHTVDAVPVQKLLVITVVEATGNIFLQASSQIIRELAPFSEKKYKYFGVNHLIVDSEHYCLENGKNSIEGLQLDKDVKTKSYELIEQIFLIFTEYVKELLTYAKLNSPEMNLSKSVTQYAQDFKPIGSYLVEAGLVKTEQLQEALSQQRLTSNFTPIGQILARNGWIKQETIEYLMEKIILPEQNMAILN